MKRVPIKFEPCDRNEHMSDLVYQLMDCAEKNVDLGYHIDLQHLEEIVGAGMTYDTLDMLINNLNQSIEKQYQNSLLDNGMQTKQAIH